ncbi:MAG: hypothetical protein F7B17_05120 [Desulfurococcales archaeon]|nr:hypothetical protein [Desulfurococcales archaeon]
MTLEQIAKEAAESIYNQLGLEAMGVGREDVIPLLEDIALSIAGEYSSKPSPESVARRALAQRDALLKALAAKLAEKGEKLSLEELEFIIQYAPEVAGRAAPLLYHVARSYGADHLMPALRDLWSLYGNPTKAECPRCGFRALTPDYTCVVCGASVGESEFKARIAFERLLEAWALRAPLQLVEEAIRAGYVYYEDGEIKAPSEPGSRLRLQVFLSRSEREILEKALERVKAEKASSTSSSQPQASPRNTS